MFLWLVLFYLSTSCPQRLQFALERERDRVIKTCLRDAVDILITINRIIILFLIKSERSRGRRGLGVTVHHYNLVSDPGTHSYKEVLVSLLWTWEISLGMHTPWQHLKPGSTLTRIALWTNRPSILQPGRN